MPRRLVHLLLAFALLFQTLILLIPAKVSEQGHVLEHALVHEAGTGHHHHLDHDDEHCGQQLDIDYDVDTAVFHVHHDAVSQVACLPPAVYLAVDLRPAALGKSHVERSLTAPFLEGLLRPPRAAA